jgi:protein-disulfide isomerase
VVVVKFNDYQCPPCRQTFADYGDLFAAYARERPGAVRLVLKDFPLEAECNAGVTSSLHAAGCEAAVAVRLARERGTSEALERWLFANQAGLTPELVEQGAREVGGVTDFRDRYGATLDEVKADIDYGRTLGVRATPTFFINGVMIQGGLPPHLFKQAIETELQKNTSAP